MRLQSTGALGIIRTTRAPRPFSGGDCLPTRRTYLQVALTVVGVLMLLVYPLMRFWPAGWTWQPGQHEYDQMIVGIYATLGIFLLLAARNPEAHTSLIWFA